MYGDFIRRVRHSRGISQAQLARIIGTSQPTLSDYERDRKLPSADTLNRIVVGCGYLLTAVAGSRHIGCPLPRAGWFAGEDLPPRLPGDPPDEPPLLSADSPENDRLRDIEAIIHAGAALIGLRSQQ